MFVSDRGPSGMEQDSSNHDSVDIVPKRTRHTGSVAVGGEVSVADWQWALVKGTMGTVRFRTITGESTEPTANFFRHMDPDNHVTELAVSIYANPNQRTKITTEQAGDIVGIEAKSEAEVISALSALYTDPAVDPDTFARTEPAYQFALQATAARAELYMLDRDGADRIIGMVFAKSGLDPMVFVPEEQAIAP